LETITELQRSNEELSGSDKGRERERERERERRGPH